MQLQSQTANMPPTQFSTVKGDAPLQTSQTNNTDSKGTGSGT